MKKILVSLLVFGAMSIAARENLSTEVVRLGAPEQPRIEAPTWDRQEQKSVEQQKQNKSLVQRVREGVSNFVQKVKNRYSTSLTKLSMRDTDDVQAQAANNQQAGGLEVGQGLQEATQLPDEVNHEQFDLNAHRQQLAQEEARIAAVRAANKGSVQSNISSKQLSQSESAPATSVKQALQMPSDQEFVPNVVQQPTLQAPSSEVPVQRAIKPTAQSLQDGALQLRRTAQPEKNNSVVTPTVAESPSETVVRSNRNADLLAGIRNQPQLRKVNVEQVSQPVREVKNSQVQGLIDLKERSERAELGRLEKSAQEDPDEFEDQERLDELRAKYGSAVTPQSRVQTSAPVREVQPANVVAEQPQKSVVVTRSVAPVSVPVEIKPAAARIEQPVETKQEVPAVTQQGNNAVVAQVTWADVAGANSGQDRLESNGASISYQNISGNRSLNSRQQQAIVLKAKSLQPGDEVVVDKEGLVTTKNELLERAQQEVNRVAEQQRVQMLEAQSKARIANIKGTLTAQIQAGAILDAKALRKAVEGSLGVGSREANAVYSELYKENKERFTSVQAPAVTAKQESKEQLLAQVQPYLDSPATLTGVNYMRLSDAAKKAFVTEYIQRYGTDAASRNNLPEVAAVQKAFDAQVADMQKAAAPRKTLSAESKAAASQALTQAAAKKASASSAPVAKKEVVQTNGLDTGVVEGLKNQLEKNPTWTREQALDYVDRIGYGRDARYLEGMHFKGELDEGLINRFKNRPADKTPESLARFLKMNGISAEDLPEYQKAVFGDVAQEETKAESAEQESSTQPVLNPDVITKLKTMGKIKQRGFLTSQGIMGEAQQPYLDAAAA